MNKSVLIVDTPESCRKCDLTYIEEYWDKYCCAITGQYIEEYNNNKSPWCPLSPLSQIREEILKGELE